MSKEPDNYVLGTDDEELSRLGLQHRVWRPTVLKVWADAGITEGSRVVDLGCGPGFATFDLAEIAGPGGAVLGVERSPKFLNFARAESQRRGFNQVKFLEADLMRDLEFGATYDAVWCRWIACFLPNLDPLITHLRKALRRRGMAIFHEYIDYGTWQSIPRCHGIEKFAAEIMRNWRGSGGEPDIARAVVPKLIAGGFEITQARPIIFAVKPCDFMWRWPSSFIKSHVGKLVQTGTVTAAWGEEILADFAKLEGSPDSIMLTPTVLQIVARKNEE